MVYGILNFIDVCSSDLNIPITQHNHIDHRIIVYSNILFRMSAEYNYVLLERKD